MAMEMDSDPAARAPRRRTRILVLCPYPHGVAAVQRFKFERFYDDWRANGYDVTVSPFMGMALWRVLYEPGHQLRKAFEVAKGYARRAFDLLRIRSYDIVFVHAWVTPLGPALSERLARKLARRLVFDLEDNLLADGNTEVEKHPNPILRFLRSREKGPYLVKTADHVITSTPYLEEAAARLNVRGRATYIPPSVDTDRIGPPARRDGGTVTIGWTGTFSSKPYLDLLANVFQELARRLPFRLLVIGNFDYELAGVDVKVVRWSAEREAEDLQEIDIGVYPLPVNEWVFGKGGLKAVQYMIVEAPPVATDVGTVSSFIRNGENGFLVRTDEEWLEALERLIRDPELRQRVGRQARIDAVKTYSANAVSGDYRRVLSTLLETDR
jgi:glycosyltransferase involved in cell wall biosynthesis